MVFMALRRESRQTTDGEELIQKAAIMYTWLHHGPPYGSDRKSQD
jgi:hypothetical protein